jgi:hypothetical protein
MWQRGGDGKHCEGTARARGADRTIRGEATMTLDKEDFRQVQASLKSYTGIAILVFVLYLFFWLPGFIVNIIYLREANRMQAVAGHGLPGVGCLTIELVLSIIGIAFACVAVLILGLGRS